MGAVLNIEPCRGLGAGLWLAVRGVDRGRAYGIMKAH